MNLNQKCFKTTISTVNSLVIHITESFKTAYDFLLDFFDFITYLNKMI